MSQTTPPTPFIPNMHKYEWDEFMEKYHLKDKWSTIKKRIATANKFKAEGLPHNEAWKQAFKDVPHIYQDPHTGLAYPVEET